jgi:hypothetical protein
MKSKTLTLQLPAFHDRSVESDRVSLSLLRAVLVVGEHIVEHRCRYDGRREPLRETALLLRSKLQEVLGSLDVYEHKLNTPPSEEIPF